MSQAARMHPDQGGQSRSACARPPASGRYGFRAVARRSRSTVDSALVERLQRAALSTLLDQAAQLPSAILLSEFAERRKFYTEYVHFGSLEYGVFHGIRGIRVEYGRIQASGRSFGIRGKRIHT